MIGVISLVILFAFVGAPLWKYSYSQITPDNSAPPSGNHPFGTDNLGRDLFSRVILGTRGALEVALAVVALASAIGVRCASEMDTSGIFGKAW